MFDGGLAAAVDALARVAFAAGLVAARLEPPVEDAEAFYCGLIQGIQESDFAGEGRRAPGLPPSGRGHKPSHAR